MIRNSFLGLSSFAALALAAADVGGSSRLDELEQDIANRTGESLDEVDAKLDILSDITGTPKEEVAGYVDEGFKQADASDDDNDLDDEDGDNDDTVFDNGNDQ